MSEGSVSLKRPKLWLVLLLLGVLLAGAGLYRYLAGPKVAAYALRLQPIVQEVVVTGRVIASSRAQIGSEITGVVLERRVREGDRVQAGDVLVVLRADEFEARVREAEASLDQLLNSRRPQALAALREAELQLAQARREAERRAGLARVNAVSRESLEQARQVVAHAQAAEQQARLQSEALAPGRSEESILRQRLAAAKAALGRTVVRAEVDGTILTRAVEPGDLVQPGQVLFDMARSGPIELLAPVDERNLAVLAIGQRATVIADAYPAQPFEAVVSFIAPSVDAQRGTVDIRLRLDAPPAFLLEDMTVSISVLTAQRERGLALPNDALIPGASDEAWVLAVRDGRVVRVPVRLGLKGLASTEVVAGIDEGEWVLADTGVEPGRRVRPQAQTLPAAAHPDRTRGESPLPLG